MAEGEALRQSEGIISNRTQKKIGAKEGKSGRRAHLQPGLTIWLERSRGEHGGSAGRIKMAAVCSGPAPLGPGIKETERRPAAPAQGTFRGFFFAMTRGGGCRVEPEGSGEPVGETGG